MKSWVNVFSIVACYLIAERKNIYDKYGMQKLKEGYFSLGVFKVKLALLIA